MRSSAKQATQEPEKALKDFTSILKPAQREGSKGNGSDCVDDERLADAMNGLQDVLSVGTKDG